MSLPAFAADPGYRWRVLITVMLGTLMSALDTSIVNVSIPAMMRDFSAGVHQVQWVVTAYMIGLAVLMPLTGWGQEQFGERRLFAGSLIVFTLGSLLCGIAWNIESLIVFRVIQALGGGAILPASMAMITEVFPKEERGRALGFWGVGVVMGPAFGPALGGVLTEYFGWRSVFLINLPIGIYGLYRAFKYLRPDAPRVPNWRSFDLPGFALLSVVLTAFLYGVSQGETQGWGAPDVVVCWAISLAGFAAFLAVESRSRNRIIRLELFRNRVFALCFSVTFIRSMALFGSTFLVPLFLQQALGLPESRIGMLMLPGALLIGAFMPISGRLADRYGSRWLTVAGLLGLAAFMASYGVLSPEMGRWHIQIPILLRGVGLGLLVAPVTAAALNAAPAGQAAMVSMLLSLAQQVGGSLGIAVEATVLDIRTRQVAAIDPGAAPVLALLRGYEAAFLVGAAITLAAVVLALRLPTGRQGHRTDVPAVEGMEG